MIKRHLLTLFLYFRILSLSFCAVNIYPQFQAIENKNIEIEPEKRFRTYSDVDFDEKAAYKNKTKFEGVKYENFYEFLRFKLIKSDVKFIETLEKSILGQELNFPVLKLWLMLDKLMREPAITSGNPAFVEYVLLVVKLTTNEEDSTDPNVFSSALESLKNAIRAHKPSIILRTLMKFLSPQLRQNETLAIFKIIYASMKKETISQPGNLSKDFKVLVLALEELDPISWFDYLYMEGLDENEFPLQIILSSFYYLFLKADRQDLIEPIMVILDNCVFDQNKENLEIISNFLNLTNFCTRVEDDEEIRIKRSKIFKFVLKKFEIEAVDYEKQFALAVERSSLSLVEAFLLYTDIFLFDPDHLYCSILNAIFSSKIEMTVLIITYRPVFADEFIAKWKSVGKESKFIFGSLGVDIIINLLRLSNEFDSDYADYNESIDEDGFIIHYLPEPEKYEEIAKIPFTSVSFPLLKNYWMSRIILARYFGIAFGSTRIQRERDASPIWREVADAINAFLFMRKSNHRVYFTEEPDSRVITKNFMKVY